jgi:hypothetical protein
MFTAVNIHHLNHPFGKVHSCELFPSAHEPRGKKRERSVGLRGDGK